MSHISDYSADIAKLRFDLQDGLDEKYKAIVDAAKTKGVDTSVEEEGLSLRSLSNDLMGPFIDTTKITINGNLGKDISGSTVEYTIDPLKLPAGYKYQKRDGTIEHVPLDSTRANINLFTDTASIGNRWVNRNIYKFTVRDWCYHRLIFKIPLSKLGGSPYEGDTSFIPEEIIFSRMDNEKDFIHFINLDFTDTTPGVVRGEDYNTLYVLTRKRFSASTADPTQDYTSMYNTIDSWYDMDTNELCLALPDMSYGYSLIDTIWECKVILRYTASKFTPNFNTSVEELVVDLGQAPSATTSSTKGIVNGRILDNSTLLNSRYDKNNSGSTELPELKPNYIVNNECVFIHDTDTNILLMNSVGDSIVYTSTEYNRFIYDGNFVFPQNIFKINKDLNLAAAYDINTNNILVSFFNGYSRPVSDWIRIVELPDNSKITWGGNQDKSTRFLYDNMSNNIFFIDDEKINNFKISLDINKLEIKVLEYSNTRVINAGVEEIITPYIVDINTSSGIPSIIYHSLTGNYLTLYNSQNHTIYNIISTMTLFGKKYIANLTNDSISLLNYNTLENIITKDISFDNFNNLLIISSDKGIISDNSPLLNDWEYVEYLASSGMTMLTSNSPNNRYVGFPDNGSVVLTSTNLTTWTPVQLQKSSNWVGLSYFKNMYVILSKDDNMIYYSTNGTNWTTVALPTGVYTNIVCNDTVIVAVSNSEFTYSTNVTTWSALGNLPVEANWDFAIEANNTLFLTSGVNLLSSSNGSSWTSRTSLLSGYTWSTMVYFMNKYILFPVSGSIYLSSSNLTSWSSISLPSTLSNIIACENTSKLYISGKTGDTNEVHYTEDMLTWKKVDIDTNDWSNIYYIKTNLILTSSDLKLAIMNEYPNNTNWESSNTKVNTTYTYYLSESFPTNYSLYTDTDIQVDKDGNEYIFIGGKVWLRNNTNWEYVNIPVKRGISKFKIYKNIFFIQDIRPAYTSGSYGYPDLQSIYWSTSITGPYTRITARDNNVDIWEIGNDKLIIQFYSNYSGETYGTYFWIYEFDINLTTVTENKLLREYDAESSDRNNNVTDYAHYDRIQYIEEDNSFYFYVSERYNVNWYTNTRIAVIEVLDSNMEFSSSIRVSNVSDENNDFLGSFLYQGNRFYITKYYVHYYNDNGSTYALYNNKFQIYSEATGVITIDAYSASYIDSIKIYISDGIIVIVDINTKDIYLSYDAITWVKNPSIFPPVPDTITGITSIPGTDKLSIVAYYDYISQSGGFVGDPIITTYNHKFYDLSFDKIYPNFNYQLLPSSEIPEYSLCVYGKGYYLVFAPLSKTFLLSINSTIWTTLLLNTTPRNWSSISYINDKFIMTALDTNILAYSDDGITWIQTTLPISSKWVGITYFNKKYILISSNTSNIYTSTDLTTWNRTDVTNSLSYKLIGVSKDTVIIISNNSNIVTYTIEGTTWHTAVLPESASWSDLIYANDKFILVAGNTDYILYSTSGLIWTKVSLGHTYNWKSLVYMVDKYVISATNTNKILYSTNLETWSLGDLPQTATWTDMCIGDYFTNSDVLDGLVLKNNIDSTSIATIHVEDNHIIPNRVTDRVIDELKDTP